jgi:hypothetical protein
MRVAFQHGAVSGGYYGAIFGLAVGIYSRKVQPIVKYSVGGGVAYGSFLSYSNFWRIDI